MQGINRSLHAIWTITRREFGMFFVSPVVFLMMFVAPALTMRLIAEENRSGTHELLETAPVHDWEIVVGKWLAVWGAFTSFMLMTLFYAAILAWRGNPDGASMFTGYLGLWLMAGASFAIGVLASSLTQYQPIAFMVSMGTILMLWLSDVLLARLFTSPLLTGILTELSLQSHYRNLIQRALIDPVDIAYFIGVIAVSLFFASQTLNSRRWRA